MLSARLLRAVSLLAIFASTGADLVIYNGNYALVRDNANPPTFKLPVGHTFTIEIHEDGGQDLSVFASEENGLPPKSQFVSIGGTECTNIQGECKRRFTFTAGEDHAGKTYRPLFYRQVNQELRGSATTLVDSDLQQFQIAIEVVGWTLSISMMLPAEKEAVLGSKVALHAAVQITAGTCPSGTNYTGSTIITYQVGNDAIGVGDQCFGPGPEPMFEGVMGQTYPSTSTGLLEGSTLMRSDLSSSTPLTATYEFVWEPMVTSASSAPSRLCLQAFYRTPAGTKVMGGITCSSIHVPKCRHTLRPGETMESLAHIYGTHWLQLFHANPSLPSGNPDKVPAGYEARLGVLYSVRQGEDLARVAQKFLISPEDLLELNPELAIEAMLTFAPAALDVVAQITIEFSPRRSIAVGEQITIRVDGVTGPSWSGSGIPSCPTPYMTTNNYTSTCNPATRAPGDPCGAGGWGECKYDPSGVMFCMEYSCSDAGMHPLIGSVRWDSGMSMISVTANSIIDAGAKVKLVVPKSAGLMNSLHPQPTAHQPSPLRPLMNPRMVPGMVPLATSISHPSGSTPNQLCVALPLCEDGLDCLFGSDCQITDAPTGL